MSLYPDGGDDGMVLVRLSAVPLDIRIRVADEIIARGALRPLDAIEYRLAAQRPVDNPALLVSREKAERVVLAGKLPLGALPPVWNY